MPNSLDDLFKERAETKAASERINERIAQEVDDRVLSVIYLGLPFNGLKGLTIDQIESGMRQFYDPRFNEEDISGALARSTESGKVIYDGRTYDLPKSLVFELVPVLKYKLEKRAEPASDDAHNDLPF